MTDPYPAPKTRLYALGVILIILLLVGGALTILAVT